MLFGKRGLLKDYTTKKRKKKLNLEREDNLLRRAKKLELQVKV